MAEVTVEGEFGSDVEASWALVGDFIGSLQALGVPIESEGEGIGQIRRVPLGAEPTVERLEERDEEAKRLVYSIVSSPMGLEGYRSTMQLSPLGADRTRLTWSGTFEAAEGTSEEDAVNLVRSIYQGGIAGFQGKLGA